MFLLGFVEEDMVTFTRAATEVMRSNVGLYCIPKREVLQSVDKICGSHSSITLTSYDTWHVEYV